MIYQYVKRYLKHSYKKPKIDFIWTASTNDNIIKYLNKRYKEQEYSGEISEVKEAFKDFFEPIGNIVFRYKKDIGIRFKVFPYRIKPENSNHLDAIVSIIKDNPKAIKKRYQGQDNQISISGKIRRSINSELIDSEESVNAKELIKYAIKIALKLSDRDIVVQLKRKYIVKIVDKTVEVKNNLNGYNSEQIEETYRELFNGGIVTINMFLKKIINKLLKKQLNFQTMSNSFHQNKSIKIIYAEIIKELGNYLSLEQDYLKGVAGYIIRKQFYKIHELMAIELLKLIAAKDVNAIKFMMYYDGQLILIDSKKHKKALLETDDGQKWCNVGMPSICARWQQERTKMLASGKDNHKPDLILKSVTKVLSSKPTLVV